jgi:hypothetical protein
MTKETVFSPIKDPYIKHSLGRSPIWKQCYHEGEEFPLGNIYVYMFKFDGLKPVQLIKMTSFNNR